MVHTEVEITRGKTSGIGRGGLVRLEKPLEEVFRAAGQSPDTFLFWASDEGLLNAEALHERGLISVERLLLVKTQTPEDVWRVGQEAVETALFGGVLLKPSRLCALGPLRKLQITAERTRTRVILLTRDRVPHWLCKAG